MGGTATASKGDDDGESGVLEHFVFDVVAALIGALEARGKGMRKGLGAIFLVNNGELKIRSERRTGGRETRAGRVEEKLKRT